MTKVKPKKRYQGYIKIREWVERTRRGHYRKGETYHDNPIRGKKYPIVEATSKKQARLIIDGMVRVLINELADFGTVTTYKGTPYEKTLQRWYAENVSSYIKIVKEEDEDEDTEIYSQGEIDKMNGG